MDNLKSDIKYVAGVGEARARLLDKELGIRTVGDLLDHFPFRYIDRTRIYRISEITDDADAEAEALQHIAVELLQRLDLVVPEPGL